MAEIHVIARKQKGLKRLPDGNYESGDWYVSDETADKLIGGEIYLHDDQGSNSYFGGKIQEVKRLDDGRKVFIFNGDAKCKNVKTDKEGWGQEKKIILD